MMTDPIADLLTRVRNACMAGHRKVDIPSSKMKREIARILKERGFIHNFAHVDSKAGATDQVVVAVPVRVSVVQHGHDDAGGGALDRVWQRLEPFLSNASVRPVEGAHARA